MNKNQSNRFVELVSEMEKLEKNHCNLPQVFAEVFKDEVNANDEHKMYNGVKRVIKKYAVDGSSISAIDEFFRVISGGASLDEIIRISMDETVSPTPSSGIRVDPVCRQ